MNSLLPNMRLLGLASSLEGKDYVELCTQIDEARESLGFDLAEEAVYFFFTEFPDECRIARSVIGPIRDTGPYLLWDWVAAPVHRENLQGRTWGAIQDQVQNLLSRPHLVGKKALVRLVRRVTKGQFSLEVEGIVHD